MTTLTAIGVLSLAKLLAGIMASVGLIAGVLYAGIGAIYDIRRVGLNPGSALACLAIIGMPILFAVAGFSVGALGAFLYNLVAAKVGGMAVSLGQ